MKLKCKTCGTARHFTPKMEMLRRPRIIRVRSMDTGQTQTLEIAEVQNWYCITCGRKK